MPLLGFTLDVPGFRGEGPGVSDLYRHGNQALRDGDQAALENLRPFLVPEASPVVWHPLVLEVLIFIFVFVGRRVRSALTFQRT